MAWPWYISVSEFNPLSCVYSDSMRKESVPYIDEMLVHIT